MKVNLTLKKIGEEILSYFKLSDDLEPQADAEATIRAGVSFKGSQLIVLIFAILIASLGLNTNSVPVIIGAMLISPLMGPIIGMGLGIGIQDFQLLRRGLKNIMMAMVGSILASALYFLLSPMYEGSSQLLARTSPSIYDVLVGFFGGSAGILSIAVRNKGQVMPGVAIATSLMPPLCTVGYGLATLQAQYFFGALYLFFINMVFILFATWVGVKLMKYKTVVHPNTRRSRRVQMIVWTIVGATVVGSGFLTYQMVRKNNFLAAASEFVKNEMVFPNTQVLNHQEYMEKGKRYISVTLIGQALPKDSLQLAMLNKLDSCGLGGTILDIKQGFDLGASERLQEKSLSQYYGVLQSELLLRQSEVDSLKGVIRSRDQLAHEAERLSAEVNVLFPNISDMAFSQMIATRVDSVRTDTVDIVFVHAPAGISEAERVKFREYMQVRLGLRDVNLSVNPQNFPWPK